MHRYRTHTCGQLRSQDSGAAARLSGWVHRKRDHGNLLFVDLRDHYGVTQCVVDVSSPIFTLLESARPESVLTVTGKVVNRSPETLNAKLATGEIELQVEAAELQSTADVLPMQVAGEQEFPEEMRLRSAISICAGKRCMPICCCAARSSPRCGGACRNRTSSNTRRRS